MDPVASIIGGVLGGLTSVLIQGLVMPARARLRARAPATWHKFAVWRVGINAGIHATAAAMLGVFFWLSWGLAGLYGLSWWLQGMLFGLIAWIALALPALGSVWLYARLEMRALPGFICDWLLTCLAAGIACAWLASRVS